MITGRVSPKVMPPPNIPLITINSPPLMTFIQQLNQESNNVIAENLIQFIGKKGAVADDTLQSGIDALRLYCINVLNIDPLHFIIDDVTGLSLTNKFKAHDFMKVLRLIFKDPQLYSLMQQSLVQQGVTVGMNPKATYSYCNVFKDRDTCLFWCQFNGWLYSSKKYQSTVCICYNR